MSCCHPARNQTGTHRCVNPLAQAKVKQLHFKKEKKKEATLLVYYCHGLTQSISPSFASDMAERSSARCSASPRVSCSAYRTRSPRRSTSLPRARSVWLPVFPSQLCGEAPHLSGSGSMAAPRCLPHRVNSFRTASACINTNTNGHRPGCAVRWERHVTST